MAVSVIAFAQDERAASAAEAAAEALQAEQAICARIQTLISARKQNALELGKEFRDLKEIYIERGKGVAGRGWSAYVAGLDLELRTVDRWIEKYEQSVGIKPKPAPKPALDKMSRPKSPAEPVSQDASSPNPYAYTIPDLDPDSAHPERDAAPEPEPLPPSRQNLYPELEPKAAPITAPAPATPKDPIERLQASLDSVRDSADAIVDSALRQQRLMAAIRMWSHMYGLPIYC
jgi:hypothetical protein